MSKNANSAGNIIKEARESYNYTTEECAEKLGISTRYLQKIENEGNLPSYGTLRNIVQLFSIDANYLFYDDYDKEDLRNVLDQYLKLNKEKKEFFKFKNKIGYQKIDVQDIYYFESENKIVKIHCTNNIIKFYGKLNDVEQKLNDSFIRIHSSILVNSVYIAQFKYNEVKMINGELLPISQSRRQYIRKKQMDRWENNS